jgi:alcohol dehydrogenase class IV
MAYWFENPTLKALAPLALSTSIKGLTTIFNTPKMFIGANVFPEGPVVGPSTMDTLANRCAKKRAFIVTDEFGNKFAAKAARFLQSGGFTVEIWPRCLPEAPMEVVAECAKAMKAYEPDLIMAVGGGSVMDTAKAAWLLYERPDITELGMISPLDKLNLRKKALLAAVPTTSGTGSECTGVSVIHDNAASRKIPITHDELFPDFAILDPQFTISMPPKLTAGTGLDVLAHAMDSVTTPASNEFTEPLALKAIEMVFQWLPRAYQNGQDKEARHRMLIAASIAGIAFGNNGGAHLTHSLGHSLGSVFNMHHGLCVGYFIPHTLQFCSAATDKHMLICQTLGIEAKDAKRGLVKLVARVRSFLTELGVPLTLKELGISRADFDRQFDKLVKFAYEDVDCYLSPRPITAAQCAQVFRYAYDGRDIDF